MLTGSLNITSPFSCHSVAWGIFFSDDFSPRIWVRLNPRDWQKVTWTVCQASSQQMGHNIPSRLVSITAWMTTVNGVPFFCKPLFLSAPLCVHFVLSAVSAGHRTSGAYVEKQRVMNEYERVPRPQQDEGNSQHLRHCGNVQIQGMAERPGIVYLWAWEDNVMKKHIDSG